MLEWKLHRKVQERMVTLATYSLIRHSGQWIILTLQASIHGASDLHAFWETSLEKGREQAAFKCHVQCQNFDLSEDGNAKDHGICYCSAWHKPHMRISVLDQVRQSVLVIENGTSRCMDLKASLSCKCESRRHASGERATWTNFTCSGVKMPDSPAKINPLCRASWPAELSMITLLFVMSTLKVCRSLLLIPSMQFLSSEVNFSIRSSSAIVCTSTKHCIPSLSATCSTQ